MLFGDTWYAAPVEVLSVPQLVPAYADCYEVVGANAAYHSP